MKRKRPSRAQSKDPPGPSQPTAEPVADAVGTADEIRTEQLLDTWSNLEKEFSSARAERDRLRAELDAHRGQLAEQERSALAYRSQAETLQEELTVTRKRLAERTAALEDRQAGRGSAERRLADYRDALLGMEHTLAEREQAMLQHAAAKAELTARIAELERQFAEITGRWRESEAANTRLQGMLTDAARGAERLEGEARRWRERAASLERQAAELAALKEELKSKKAIRPGEEGARLRESSGALKAEQERSAGLEARLRAELPKRNARITELEAQVAKLAGDVAATENIAELAVAARDRVADELKQKLADIARLEQQLGELAAGAEGRRQAPRETGSDRRRQHNSMAVVDREIERMQTVEVDARAREDLLARHTESAGEAAQRRRARLLVSLDGDHNIKYPLYKATMIIGRSSDADIHIIGRFTSRRHARVVILEDDTAVIEDLGSLNGIRVNDQLVSRHTLRDGDLLDIGGANLQFIDLDERETASRSNTG